MKNRFFVAINIPDEIKDKIEAALEKIRYKFTNDVRFLERGNWHITITFLGWQDNEFLIPIIDGIKKTASRFSPMEIELIDIDYGPQNKPPRMIWLNVSVSSSQNLSILKKDLDENFRNKGVVFNNERHVLNAHITLARFKAAKSLPDIKTRLRFHFQAKSLDLMESHLFKAGAQYGILQSEKFNLKL